MELLFDRVTAADKPRVLEIAAQVWEGEDYLPEVLDHWLTASDADLIAARVEGLLVGLARYVRLLPGYAWFEGLRVDPAWQGRGIGKALTRRLLEQATAERMQRGGLASHAENLASDRVAQAFGFRRVAGFVYLEAWGDGPARREARPSPEVVTVSPDEALSFVRGSAFLAAGHGFFPNGWVFYPFHRGPETVIARTAHRLGIRRAGRLVALLCIGAATHGAHQFPIDFLDGEAEAMEVLVRHALSLAPADAYVEAMMPRPAGPGDSALEVLRRLGFSAWNDFQEDVFVYERDLTRP